MIVEWLLDAVETLITWVASLFPSVTFDPVAAFGSVLNVLGDVNYFFPVQELAVVVLGFLALALPFMGIQLVIWIVALIRGGSANG